MVAEIKADMAEQLARVKAMEKEDDVCVNPWASVKVTKVRYGSIADLRSLTG